MTGVKEKPAFTLMEVIVSVALFAVIILSTTAIFKMTIDSQRRSIASQNVQESLKYFLEMTGKEIRMAQKNQNVCTGLGQDDIYKASVEHDTLSFRNQTGECVDYFLASASGTTRFKVRRTTGGVSQEDYITPQAINIDSARFMVQEGINRQPLVTITIGATARAGQMSSSSEMRLQTSLCSRNYK